MLGISPHGLDLGTEALMEFKTGASGYCPPGDLR